MSKHVMQADRSIQLCFEMHTQSQARGFHIFILEILWAYGIVFSTALLMLHSSLLP